MIYTINLSNIRTFISFNFDNTSTFLKRKNLILQRNSFQILRLQKITNKNEPF